MLCTRWTVLSIIWSIFSSILLSTIISSGSTAVLSTGPDFFISLFSFFEALALMLLPNSRMLFPPQTYKRYAVSSYIRRSFLNKSSVLCLCYSLLSYQVIAIVTMQNWEQKLFLIYVYNSFPLIWYTNENSLPLSHKKPSKHAQK